MKKYYLFIILLFIFIIDNSDKQIMLDYIINSNKYIELHTNNKRFKFIKLFLFKVIFIILFFIYPIIGFINTIKKFNFSLKNIYSKMKHPITIFDPSLSSYNIYPHNKYYHFIIQNSFWHYLFNHYKIPFKKGKYNKYDNLLKIQTSNDKVLYTYYNNLEFKDEILVDIKTNTKYHNSYIDPEQLNEIQILCVKLHRKLSSDFKIIEWNVIIEDNHFYFHSGKINTELLQIYDYNYSSKYNHLIKILL
jgi:hypothetical protein